MKTKDALAFIPKGYEIMSSGDEMMVARNGRFIYICYRLEDLLSFTVKQTLSGTSYAPDNEAEATFYNVPDDAEIDIKELSLLVQRLEESCNKIEKQRKGVIK